MERKHIGESRGTVAGEEQEESTCNSQGWWRNGRRSQAGIAFEDSSEKTICDVVMLRRLGLCANKEVNGRSLGLPQGYEGERSDAPRECEERQTTHSMMRADHHGCTKEGGSESLTASSRACSVSISAWGGRPSATLGGTNDKRTGIGVREKQA